MPIEIAQLESQEAHINYDFVTFEKADNILLTFQWVECILYVDISNKRSVLFGAVFNTV